MQTPVESPENMRCTQATLAAFGVEGCPRHGTGVMGALQDASYILLPFGTGVTWEEDMKWIGRTVRAFVKAHPLGDYHLSTREHAMALRDGVLTDTSARGADGRRLQGIDRVVKHKQRR